MAEKSVSRGRKPAAEKETTAKKSVAKSTVKSATKSSSRRSYNKGDNLVCGVCGLSVIVDDFGDVVGAEEVICCGEPMKSRSRARAAKK